MIKVIDIHKSYDKVEVLKGINLEISKSEIVTIMGASGAGKTTLLQIIGTIDKADKGEIIFNGNNLSNLNDKKISQFRNKYIGFIFQFHHLLPEFNTIENVCLPAFIAKTSKKQAIQKAEELLEYLNMTERKFHKPSELSGGEQQRVAVARALINSPEIILADEPSGNLDSKNATELHNLFFKLRDKFNQTFLIVTHNQELANMSDRVVTMKDGKIIN